MTALYCVVGGDEMINKIVIKGGDTGQNKAPGGEAETKLNKLRGE